MPGRTSASRVGWKKAPGPGSGAPPTTTRAPAATDVCTWRSRSSHQVGTGEGADLGRAIERIADLERGDALAKPGLELVGDWIDGDEALGGDAALSVVDHARLDRRGGRGLEIGVGEHDEGIRSAELQHHLLERRARGGPDGLPRRLRCR